MVYVNFKVVCQYNDETEMYNCIIINCSIRNWAHELVLFVLFESYYLHTICIIRKQYFQSRIVILCKISYRVDLNLFMLNPYIAFIKKTKTNSTRMTKYL